MVGERQAREEEGDAHGLGAAGGIEVGQLEVRHGELLEGAADVSRAIGSWPRCPLQALQAGRAGSSTGALGPAQQRRWTPRRSSARCVRMAARLQLDIPHRLVQEDAVARVQALGDSIRTSITRR